MKTAVIRSNDGLTPGYLFRSLAEGLAPAASSGPKHRASKPVADEAAANDDVARAAVSAPAKRSLLSRIDAWFWREQQRDLEAYLGQSVDIAEVEARMRAIERGERL
jgi:hypothetical protein